MALPSTLKRHDPSSNDNDSLNDDDDDVTWGGKRPRFIYNFVLDDSPLLSYDSDQTESVHSSQSKSTMQLLSDVDVSICGSSCSDCNLSDMTEFDVRSTSSSCNNIDSNITDSSTTGSTMEFIKTEENLNSTMCDLAVPDDEGYLPDLSDSAADSNWRLKWPTPACFQNCLQCGKTNPNPFFQYCHVCFRHRMDYFEDRPQPPRKSNNPLNSSSQKKEEKLQDSQEPDLPNSLEPDLPNSQESTSSGYSSLLLSQEENKNLTDLETSTVEQSKKSSNLCNICWRMPKNGIFNHVKIGHVFSCYTCAKKIWKKKGKCPMCNRKIKFVTKMIIV